MKILIPYREEKTKSSLSNIFSYKERKKLSELMIKQIINSIKEYQNKTRIYIVSPDFNGNIKDVKIYNSLKGLNEALEEAISNLKIPLLILPSDIPLIRSQDIYYFLDSNEDVVISPGERGGTNALLLRKKIPLKFQGKSFFKHLDYLIEEKISHQVYSNYRIYKDLDEKKDLSVIYNELPKKNELKKWLSKKKWK